MANKRVGVRGIRASLPGGYVIGRLKQGHGPADLIPMSELNNQIATAQSGGSTSLGVSGASNGAALPYINDHDVLANISGAAAAPVDVTVTALLDDNFTHTQGTILLRGASVWAGLALGANNYVLTSNGTTAVWAAAAAHSLATDTDVSITSPADNQILFYKNADSKWENESLSALIDAVFGSAQGDILYRGASAWVPLTPGTNGYFLQTGGASANPSWAPVGGGGGGGGLAFATQQTVAAGTTTLSVGSSNNVTAHAVSSWSNPGSATITKYSISFNMSAATDNFYLIFINSSGNGYILICNASDGNMYVEKFTSSTSATIGTDMAGTGSTQHNNSNQEIHAIGPYVVDLCLGVLGASSNLFSVSRYRTTALYNFTDTTYDFTSGTWSLYVGVSSGGATVNQLYTCDLKNYPFA